MARTHRRERAAPHAATAGPPGLAPLLWALLAVACATPESPAPPRESQPSPNASILPAPFPSAGDIVRLASASPIASTEPPASDGGSAVVKPPEPAEPFVANAKLPRDELGSRETVGLVLHAEWKWADVPAPAHVPEVDAAALREARKRTALDMSIQLATVGRMRLTLDSPAFPLPAGAELRARIDRLGHVLVWPGGSRYRILPPGTLRNLLSERRPDRTPLVRGTIRAGGEGTLLGLKTQRTEVATSFGKLVLEQAAVGRSGPAGMLLCRLLVELVAVDPDTEACAIDHIPLRARYSWEAGGSIAFEVSSLANRQELPLSHLLVPPAGAEFKPGELPPQAAGAPLALEELAALRTQPRAPEQPPGPGAPREGILAVNRTPSLAYLLLDGVPVAWVRPHQERYVIGPRPGRYVASFRDFLGQAVEPPVVVDLPARLELGVPASDAGPPP